MINDSKDEKVEEHLDTQCVAGSNYSLQKF